MYARFVKRICDWCCAFLGLLILLPLLILVAILIKIDSSGPVFFRQERVGIRGRLFLLYKFRSMTNVNRNVHRQVYSSDPEITRVGAWIRRTKVDELPQLINVLIGDMAIIGPRPCIPEMKEHFGIHSAKRYLVKPGLSSLAAVKGSVYLTWEDKGFWDAYYVDHLTFRLDMLIICRTLVVVVVGEEKLFHAE